MRWPAWPPRASGAVAHLGERFNGIEEVRGSSPRSSTRLDEIKNLHLESQLATIAGPRPNMELYVRYGLPWRRQADGGQGVFASSALLRALPHSDLLKPLFGFDGRGFIELRNRIWPMVVEQAIATDIPDLSLPSSSSSQCRNPWSLMCGTT